MQASFRWNDYGEAIYRGNLQYRFCFLRHSGEGRNPGGGGGALGWPLFLPD